ncbi:uncharacterized protein ATNIH1004_005448 [Aspergillus tanneri]|uniref:Uncharacterized protein n=1 Tax=Aspergillus tanneri TaxID=1220188 RepID=A0A5M9MP95_9EURO|nr:uncharacterized protein ATNIH1004_005448 [Aspergillus tanneri]KAA8646773.1 hypothetical protein ATNIH1004_005448 [Aspergillus tanneri]
MPFTQLRPARRAPPAESRTNGRSHENETTHGSLIMASISFRGNNHGLQIGDNRGSINAEFHLPPERPETPPGPLSTVPFARDPDFVSRDTLLLPGSRIALVGLGGVGKSQLAIEYSYQVRSQSPATWVFWVHATNAARFEQSFRDIADQVKIPERRDAQVNIFSLVENWLRDKKREAASFLRNRAPRYSVSQYLRDFQRSEREATELLEKEAGHFYRDWEAKNLILVTWQISFDHIRRTKSSATDLLSLMGFFDRQEIPENLLRIRDASNHDSKLMSLDDSSVDGETSGSDMSLDFEDDITTLRNYSFISGRWEEAEKLEAQVMETCKTKLGKDHPDTLTSMANLASTFWNQGRWEEAEKFYVQVLEARTTKLGKGHPDTLMSIKNLAMTYSNQGRWEEATRLFMRTMETYKTKLGKDHPDTLSNMNNLTVTYMNQGQLEEAEEHFMQMIQIGKTTLGYDHPSMRTCVSNLAAMYRNQGRWEEAEKLEVQVMETRKAKIGEDHHNTLLDHDAEAIN